MTTTLSTLFHGVSGVATIIDDCTILLEQFDFDGNGIDVRIYAGVGGGFAVSGDLYNFPTGYADATLTLTIPDDHSPDDVDGLFQ